MVQIIAGKRGEGKTKRLIEKANTDVRQAAGNIVYLDKSDKHMYELNNKIRLINVRNYPLEGTDGFVGFIAGILSQDHDLDAMFLDSFLSLSFLKGKDISDTVDKLIALGERFDVNFILSISMDEDEFPDSVKAKCEIKG